MPNLVHERGALEPGAGGIWLGIEDDAGLIDHIDTEAGEPVQFRPPVRQ